MGRPLAPRPRVVRQAPSLAAVCVFTLLLTLVWIWVSWSLFTVGFQPLRLDGGLGAAPVSSATAREGRQRHIGMVQFTRVCVCVCMCVCGGVAWRTVWLEIGVTVGCEVAIV